jgi:hypothetical protein
VISPRVSAGASLQTGPQQVMQMIGANQSSSAYGLLSHLASGDGG